MNESIKDKRKDLSRLNRLKSYLDDISEYINPDGGGSYPALTKSKGLVTKWINSIKED